MTSIDHLPAGAGHEPVRVTGKAGLSFELNADGGVRRIQCRDDVVNLFIGNGMEPGPTNVWLRVRRDGALSVVPLLGPRSPLRPLVTRGPSYRAAGEWQGVGLELRLVLAEAEPFWCWQVGLENRTGSPLAVDLVYAQDLALASYGAARLNEHYVSHYLDLTALEHPRAGFVVAARQNLAQGKRHPWAVLGALTRGAAYATDALQVHGLAPRMGEPSVGLVSGLPTRRLQHEHAMPAVQTEVARLAPGERWAGGFFAAVQADHPAATGPDDLAAVDRVLTWAAGLEGVVPPPATHDPAPAASTLFASAPLLECHDLAEPELRRLFGNAWRHEESNGSLLSFFHGDDAHVVLRAKEAKAQRPHGHILRTGQPRTPDEASLTSTAWMAGVFHSMVTQGHVSINRFLSTAHTWLGLFRSHGLRLFVKVMGQWRLLGVPSAFEMTPKSCRWVYRYAHGALEVVSAVEPGKHLLGLRARVLDGPSPQWLATFHIALGGDDGNDPTPVSWHVQGNDVVVPVPRGSDLHTRFPEGAFVVAPLEGSGPLRVDGDGRLFGDGRPRGLPFLCLETEPTSAFGFDLAGRLVPDVRPQAPAIPLPELRPPGDGSASREVKRLVEILPWLLDDALVHYLSPRGLEQYSGGGWGTRDVCQGPLEMLLALDCPEAARDLLLRVFAAQNADGDWPQWWQFIERERDLRARDSHGDVVFWPLLGLGRYVLATGDVSVFEARAPFYAAKGDDAAPRSVLAHVDQALEVIARRRIAGTALAAYGHGDWNDSLQPADPAMRDHLCSAWTVTLHHQTLTLLSRALRLAGQLARATMLEAELEAIRRDFRRYLVIDGVIAGYAVFGRGPAPEPLLHPGDVRTGVRFSLLPMMHAILEGLCTPDEATAHLAIMRGHLWGPDGARLFDRPFPYRGGIERLFQRAESSAFFGREIGVMYMHAHLRHAQMLAHVGDARGLLRSLSLAHAVQLRERVPEANLRQSNTYYTSSDAAFADRYEAERGYERINAGEVPLDGGWRVYSSGPGVALALVVTSMLGVRRDGGGIVVDPVIAPELDGLRAEVSVMGRRVQLEYLTGERGIAPRRVTLNGQPMTFTRLDNPYRPGGVAIPLEAWAAQLHPYGPARVRVELT